MDPTNKLDKKADILIRSGKIAKIGPNLQGDKTEVLEAKGYTIFPGFFDIRFIQDLSFTDAPEEEIA